MNTTLFFALALTVSADISPELKPKPEIIQKLKDLKPGHAVILGKADVVGEFNDTAKKWNLDKTGPQGRDFSIKMCYANDRQRALFCGANHGVPHRLNDVWEFDLASLTWAMIYAPDLNRDYMGLGKDYSDVEFKDGTFITKRGGPGIIAHSWWGLSYDSDSKRLFLMNTWVTERKKMAVLIGAKPEDLTECPPLWSFDTVSKTWKFHRTEKPYPLAPFGGMMEYLPTLKKTMWHTNNWQMQASWTYDLKTNQWTNINANGDKKVFEKQATQPEQVGYYDPKREMIIAHRHWETSHYSVKDNAWKQVINEPKDSTVVPYGHDAFAPMYWDANSGHGLLVEFKTGTIWSYDPDAIRWKKLTYEGDPIPKGGKKLAYADPTHNALIIIDGTTVWAYRYQ